MHRWIWLQLQSEPADVHGAALHGAGDAARARKGEAEYVLRRAVSRVVSVGHPLAGDQPVRRSADAGLVSANARPRHRDLLSVTGRESAGSLDPRLCAARFRIGPCSGVVAVCAAARINEITNLFQRVVSEGEMDTYIL